MARWDQYGDDVSEARRQQWRAEGIDDRREHERRWEERQGRRGSEGYRGEGYRGEGYRGSERSGGGEGYGRGREESWGGERYRGGGEGPGGGGAYGSSGSDYGQGRYGGGGYGGGYSGGGYSGGGYGGTDQRFGEGYGRGEEHRSGRDYRLGGPYAHDEGGYVRSGRGADFGGYPGSGIRSGGGGWRGSRGASPDEWFDESRRDFRGAWDDRGGHGEDRWMRDRGEHRGHEDRGFMERMGDRLREGFQKLGKGPKGYKRSDDRIREDVCERIARSGMDADEVEVEVQGGEVTLNGSVRSREDKRRLEDLVEDVFGVDEVQNHLRVARHTGESSAYGETRTGTSTSGAPAVTNPVH